MDQIPGGTRAIAVGHVEVSQGHPGGDKQHWLCAIGAGSAEASSVLPYDVDRVIHRDLISADLVSSQDVDICVFKVVLFRKGNCLIKRDRVDCVWVIIEETLVSSRALI